MTRQTGKTVITVETFQRTVVRPGRKAKIVHCEQCGAETVMITPDEAALLLQTTARQIFRSVEAGKLHFWETKGGALLVCRNSLLNPADEVKKLTAKNR